MTADQVESAMRAMLGEFSADGVQTFWYRLDQRRATEFRLRVIDMAWRWPHCVDAEFAFPDIEIAEMDDAKLSAMVADVRAKFATAVERMKEVAT